MGRSSEVTGEAVTLCVALGVQVEEAWGTPEHMRRTRGGEPDEEEDHLCNGRDVCGV